jgi:hypothetical protein
MDSDGLKSWEAHAPGFESRSAHRTVPSDYANQEHLRWMIQKDSLGQDIFLLGPVGYMDHLRLAKLTTGR